MPPPSAAERSAPQSAAAAQNALMAIKFTKQLAPLSLPEDSEGAKFTKRFDFQGTLKKPFAFADGFEELPEEPEIVPERGEVDANRKFEEERGKLWNEKFDKKGLEAQRSQIPHLKLVPHVLRGEEPALRPLDRFKTAERVTDVAGWTSTHPRSIENIRYAGFSDMALNVKAQKKIAQMTNVSFNLEVLIMRNVGLKKVPVFKMLRHLKYLDFSQNPLNDVKGLVRMLNRSPFMEVVNCLDTPMVLKPKFRPMVISTNATMTLQSVNGENVGIDERLDSIAKFGDKAVRAEIPAMRWDLQVSALPVIQRMRSSMSWVPADITQIVLPECGLTVFHVGECINLLRLDLSANLLAAARGMGIEHCSKLEFLSLKDNNLGKSELRVLPFLSSIKVLLLSGNRGLGSSPQSYRAAVIALTMNSLGDNRNPGLVQLDDDPVVPEERVLAYHKSDGKLPIEALRWKFNLIKYYGHRQILTADYLARVTVLSMPRSHLTIADLGQMLSLEQIDLSYNNLRNVGGLDSLTRLRILDLFGNLRLEMKEVMPKLLKTNGLTQVSFGVEDKASPRYAGLAKYRNKVLKDLIFNNPNLRFLDGKLITPLERVETLRIMGQDEDLIERYRFELIVNINCTMPWNRRYHFTEVGIANQYSPSDITVLRRLNDVGLTSVACDFGKFKNLEELNLSGNKLTNLRDIKLDKLPHLRILDVTRNQINTPLEELAAEIDNLKKLEVLAIRDNPATKQFFIARMKLIGFMQRMREVECTLEVIDYFISLDERVDGWRAAGGKDEDVEILRYKAIMFLRAPRTIPTDQLTELDLSLGGLSHIDVSMFGQLKVLLLTENRIQSASGLKGLSSCKRLRVLDLRRNELSKLQDVAEIVSFLPKLENLGLSGNKCMRGPNTREKLISLLPQLHQRQCSFRAIDGKEITVQEIVRTMKSPSDTHPDQVRWQVVLLRNFAKDQQKDDDDSRAQVRELDLAFCELTLDAVNLAGFSNLLKLSLRGNNVKKLEGAGIDTCLQLRELDVSSNKLKDFSDVTSLVANLNKLTHFWMNGNPCWSNGNDKRAFEYSPGDARVRFCTEISRLHEPGAALRYLNGHKIQISERSLAVQRLKLYDGNGLEQFRLDLLAEERKRDGHADIFIDTSPVLDLSNLGLASLSMVTDRVRKSMPNLQKLTLRGNQLASLDDLRGLLDVCFKLTALDLRDNQFKGDLKQLLRILKTCPGLRLLWLENSLKKAMGAPAKYAERIFKELPVLSEVDNIVHPHRQRVLHRFEEAEAAAVPRREFSSASSDDELPSYSGESSGGPGDESRSNRKSEKTLVKSQNKSKVEAAVPDRWGNVPSDKKNDDKKNNSSKKNKKTEAVPDRWAPTGTEADDDDDFSAAFESNGDDYLPKDYHNTIGRNYDLGKLTAALSQMREDNNLHGMSRAGTARGGWSDSSSDDELPEYE